MTTAYNSFVSFNWGYGSPSPAVPVDNFTGRFTTDAFFYAGNYTFTLTADDEVALIVDGVTLLDTRNAGASGKTFTVNFGMWEGMHRIEALYREYTQLAYVYINWAYGKPGTTPPPPPTQPTPVPPPANNCQPAIGDERPDRVRRLHAVHPARLAPVGLLPIERRLERAEYGIH